MGFKNIVSFFRMIKLLKRKQIGNSNINSNDNGKFFSLYEDICNLNLNITNENNSVVEGEEIEYSIEKLDANK